MTVQKLKYGSLKLFDLLETFKEFYVTFECVLCGIYITAFVIPTIINFFWMSYIEYSLSPTYVFEEFLMIALRCILDLT